jgi:modification target Cys-rich repeat protein
VQGNVTMNCNGSCTGTCDGTCELEAAGTCNGRCEGECTYTPAMGGCEAGATAKCDVSAMADVECQGKCEGEVTPPEVSAECQASVDAKAKAEVTCTPPSLSVQFEFAAGLDADAQAEFKVWLEGFKTRFAAMAALRFKLDSVSAAVEGLISASIDVVPGAIEQIEAQGGLELRTTIGLGCAVIELDAVGDALGGASSDISGSVSAFAMVSGSVGG